MRIRAVQAVDGFNADDVDLSAHLVLRAAKPFSLALVTLILRGCSFLGLGGTKYPPGSVIQPLPKGDVVIFDVTFPPGGSDNTGDRVLGIGLPDHVTVSTGVSRIIDMLRSKGWSNSLCAPSGDPYAEVGISARDFLSSYSFDGEETTVEHLLARLHRFPGSSVIVWFGYV
jgi:hypothetical protein